jgi:hypothetical protein
MIAIPIPKLKRKCLHHSTESETKSTTEEKDSNIESIENSQKTSSFLQLSLRQGRKSASEKYSETKQRVFTGIEFKKGEDRFFFYLDTHYGEDSVIGDLLNLQLQSGLLISVLANLPRKTKGTIKKLIYNQVHLLFRGDKTFWFDFEEDDHEGSYTEKCFEDVLCAFQNWEWKIKTVAL